MSSRRAAAHLSLTFLRETVVLAVGIVLGRLLERHQPPTTDAHGNTALMKAELNSAAARYERLRRDHAED